MLKKSLFITFTFLLFLKCTLQADPFSDPFAKKEQADRYFEAAIFEKAIELYHALLSEFPAHTQAKAHTCLQLAKSYYFVKEYKKIPDLFLEIKLGSIDPDPEIQALALESMFLAGLAHNQLAAYQKAADCLLPFLSFARDSLSFLYPQGLFELGFAYYHLKKYDEAKLRFLEIQKGFISEKDPIEIDPSSERSNLQYLRERMHQKESFDDPLFSLSHIYLTRIAIVESSHAQARRLLETLKQIQQKEGFLLFALPFLEGELLFHQERWMASAAFFEQALHNPLLGRCSWKEDALFYLGWCYFHAAERKDELQKAQEIFQQLTTLAPSSERALLALSQTLLIQGIRYSDKEALKKLENILSTNASFHTPEAKYQALLFKAEASPSYLERKQLFRQLTSTTYQDISLFPNGCYLSGLNDLKEGFRLAKEDSQGLCETKLNRLERGTPFPCGKGDEEGRFVEVAANQNSNLKADSGIKSQKSLEEAIESLKKSFQLLYYEEKRGQNPKLQFATAPRKKLAAQAIKYQAQAYSALNQREGLLQGLALLSQLLNLYRDDLFPLLDEPDEVYYLQGQMASALLERDQIDTFFNIGENSLIHCFESYPKGNYADASLQLLGTLYYQKKEYEKGEHIFLTLAQKFPLSPFSKEAWHWAANCAEEGNKPANQVRHYRKKLFEMHPDSPYAAEAFFRYYPVKEYSQGVPNALFHLQTMPNKFPDSPYLITAHYLLGLNALKQAAYSEAIAFFQQAADAYHLESIPEKQKNYFTEVRFRALLEKAATHSFLKEPEDHLALLSSLYRECNHSTASFFASAEGCRLEEECAYRFALSLIAGENEEKAEKVISKMLKKYQSAKITRGYYLSRAWHEKGLIAKKQHEHQSALHCFYQAENAAKGKVLSVDELLDIWIEQSLCCALLEQLDEAMLILSRVINYDAISPQRLKAMFLRAEIYEKQGRTELARRQLEAIGKKGGLWAQKAQEKLEEYGY